MVESRPEPGSGRIRASIDKLTRRVPEKLIISVNNGRIRASTVIRLNSCEYRETYPTSPEKGYHQCEYRKMVESGPVPGSGRIRVSIEKLTRRVPEKHTISVNTEKW